MNHSVHTCRHPYSRAVSRTYTHNDEVGLLETLCVVLCWNKRTRFETHVLAPIVSNPLECRGNYSATSNNMKLVHWPLVGGLLHLVQRGGDCSRSPPRSLLAVPNVTAHPSTASVPITVLLYNGTLLCGFDVPIKG